MDFLPCNHHECSRRGASRRLTALSGAKFRQGRFVNFDSQTGSVGHVQVAVLLFERRMNNLVQNGALVVDVVFLRVILASEARGEV